MRNDFVHGGALDAMRTQFLSARLPWVDLSTGVNPWPYGNVQIGPAALARLPQRDDYATCRAAMAAAWQAPDSAIVLAPGSELLIRLLPTVLNVNRIAVLSPTYGDHAQAWRHAGAEIVETEDPLSHANSVDMVVICNPNNPDGRQFAPSALREAYMQLARRGGWLVVDEAYADLDPALSLAADGGAEGLILLRSFGKFYGLPGLRLGALIAPTQVRNAMTERLGVWPVSGAALEVGSNAYRDLDWQSKMRPRLADARQRLDDIWINAGQRVIGGTSLFGLYRVDNAHAAWQILAQQGIYTRRFESSKTTLRIGLPRDEEQENRLADALTLLK